MTDHTGHYAFPHAGANERRRLELFAERLDPLTVRRIKALDLVPAAMAGPLISSGVMTAAEEARLEARLDDPDFLGWGFAFIGAWGRRPAGARDTAKS